jgi:hypothetical protein
VAEVSLQGSGVVPFVSQRVAAGVPQHVGVGFETEACLDTSPLDYAGKASGAKGRSSLRSEHEGRFGSCSLHWGIPHDLLNARLIHGEL